MIKIFEVLKIPKYLAISVISSLIMAAVYIYTQVLGIVQNIDIWLSVIPWYNAILFIVFAALFGMTLSYQIYVRSRPKICSTTKSMGTTSTATFAGFLIAQCPACASIGALFLPVSIVGFLTIYGPVLNIIVIGLLLFTIRYLGGFEKADKM